MSLNDHRRLEEEVLERLRPTPLQLRTLSKFYEVIKSRLQAKLSERGLGFIIEPEGSFAKGTLLADHWELDIFVLLKGISDEWIKSKGRELLEGSLKGLPTIVKYSEHPYVTVSLMGIEADVVPAVYREKPTGNLMGVSRTPFHTRYVASKLDKGSADEVRLLKSFFKGVGVYGAEAHIGGFSGYLTELLIITYGSFEGALQAISKWKPPVYVDPENVGDKNLLSRRYPDSPLIVVDPVDPTRNAAAAVTLEKLSTAVVAAKLYLKRPRKEFFHIFTKYASIKYGIPVAIVICEGDYANYPPGDVWGRLARASRSIATLLTKYGFKLIKHSFYTDEQSKAAAGFLVNTLRLNNLEVVEGPEPYINVDYLEDFIASRINDGIWIGEGRLMSVKRLSCPDIEFFLNLAIRQAPLPEGTRNCKVMVSDDARNVELADWGLKEWIRRELASMPAWLVPPSAP
jgi:tRNA nucleotidyltransferase (CCA-adding enzyme)